MTPLGIILGIVFIFFLGKAILETLWGLCLVIIGLLMEGLGHTLNGIAFVLHSFDKIRSDKKLKQSENKTPGADG